MIEQLHSAVNNPMADTDKIVRPELHRQAIDESLGRFFMIRRDHGAPLGRNSGGAANHERRARLADPLDLPAGDALWRSVSIGGRSE
jgi:hypothetical protein